MQDATLSFKGKVNRYNEEKLKLLNKILKGKANPKELHPTLEISGFKNGEITISEDGTFDIELEEYTGKFYEDKEIAEILSEIIEDGYVVMKYREESGETMWSYIILPKQVIELKYIPIPKKEIEKIEETIEEHCKQYKIVKELIKEPF